MVIDARGAQTIDFLMRPATNVGAHMELLNQLLARASLPEVLDTEAAAASINRRPQTLRKWACLENGPIRPIRINGRLAWRVADLQKLLKGDA